MVKKVLRMVFLVILITYAIQGGLLAGDDSKSDSGSDGNEETDFC